MPSAHRATAFPHCSIFCYFLRLLPRHSNVLQILFDCSCPVYSWPYSLPFTSRIPVKFLFREPALIHAVNMAQPLQSSLLDGILQCTHACPSSDFHIGDLVSPYNSQNRSLPSMVRCLQSFHAGGRH